MQTPIEMHNSIFDEQGILGLKRYLAQCVQYAPINIGQADALARAAIRYYRGDSAARSNLRELQEIEAKWYVALDSGTPDYTLYNDPRLLPDIWACWIVYSRGYLLSLRKPTTLDPERHYISIVDKLQPHIRSILDLGCGFGYTTAGLKELFPQAAVFGTQLKSSPQWQIAQALGACRGFAVLESHREAPVSIDCIFASEYFEHIADPYTHLQEMLVQHKPRALIVANSFRAISMGHFHTYYHGTRLIDSKQAGRYFNAYLRVLGYRKLKTALWNNRPAIWLANTP